MKRALFSHSVYVTKEMMQLVTTEKQNHQNIKPNRLTIIIRCILIPVAIIMLLWSYTFLLGLVMLISLLMAILKKPISRWWTTTKNYAALRYRYKTTFSISEDGMRIKSRQLDLNFGWDFLESYSITSEWLIFIAERNQYLFFPVKLMKQKGVYEKVISLIKSKMNRYRLHNLST